MRLIRFPILLVAAAAGCVSPAGGASGDIPVPGVYPGDRPATPARASALRDDAWTPVAEHISVLELPGVLASLLSAVPPTGSGVSVRSYAWPAPLQLTDFSAGGVLLRGSVPASRLIGDIQCLGLPLGAPIGVAVRIDGDSPAMRIEVRIDPPEMVSCEISWSGRKRTEAVATDVWMWARAVITHGSPIPARP